ncbi:PREDICTED: G-box-binding factor-like [Polistes dominula]|uniref:G-box-binding factor-like n=1 Tax=Polistes dominula TaxID=743375 RepID=A0ABM1IVM9_POLDO|nr:PREDICTED: G-box-binding factor-like [Polistes dominula]
MDLVYIPEVLTYGSFRSPLYHDFEQPWNKNYFGHDRSTRCQRLQNTQQHHQHQQQQQQQQQIIPQEYHHQEGKKTSKNCHLCRENRRRSLALYIREKSRKSFCHEIHEEIEEIDDEENQIVNNEINKSIDKAHDINVSSVNNDQRLFKAEEKFANKCMTQK